jgi:hypothetical protein
MIDDPTLFPSPTRWRVSRELSAPHECTLEGILARCGGSCCKSAVFWPSRTFETNICGNLGPEGCRLAPTDKPITCLLYPIRLVRGEMLLLHHRARFGKGICKGNHGQGPPLIDALRGNLVTLFGEEQVDRVRADVMAGRQSWVEPSDDLVRQLAAEEQAEEANEHPTLRSLL